MIRRRAQRNGDRRAARRHHSQLEAHQHVVPSTIVGAWCITTQSGSRYDVFRDMCDVWWLGGENIPNAFSIELPRGRVWQIQPPMPWPPVIGAPLLMAAPDELEVGDDARIPRGGKITSPVQRVDPIVGAISRQ